MSKHIGLFDLDSVIYQVAYGSNTLEDACSNLMTRVARILNEVEGVKPNAEIAFFQGNTGNFRKKIYIEYKANRTQAKPDNYDGLVEFCHKFYRPEHGEGVEVDDLIADAVCFYKDISLDPFIVAIDKDYLQIPNIDIYFYNRKEWIGTTESGAIHDFCLQMLMGDTADNIKGVPGIGKVRANKVLNDCLFGSVFCYLRALVKAYHSYYSGEWREYLELNYRLLKLGTPTENE
jgi:DNA polymerase-1